LSFGTRFSPFAREERINRFLRKCYSILGKDQGLIIISEKIKLAEKLE